MNVRKRLLELLVFLGDWSLRRLGRELEYDGSTFQRLIDDPSRRPNLDLAFALEELSKTPRESDGKVWPDGPLLASEWLASDKDEAATGDTIRTTVDAIVDDEKPAA